MNEVESYIAEFDGEQYKLLDYFYRLLVGEPGVTPKIRYNIPFYYRRSWVCYTNPRDGGIELAFLNGHLLSNEQGLLQARGRKMVKGVVFHRLADVPENALLEVIQEAFLLDEG
ncbi:MAG: hypothetical protein GVY26_11350 [Bacteroidetes bacterium]|jgi:hypothetical protein|nr:hypothetical protein [Bacteroidota bacterium]